MDFVFLQPFLMALVVGAASGSIGAFIILRRMALVGDALSHVALPGIALALTYSVDPFWGAMVFLVGAAAAVWWLETKSNLPADALTGLLFTASLAVGILMIPNTEIVESLFGTFPHLPGFVLGLILVASLAIIFLSFGLAKKFLFMVISPDLAKVNGAGEKYNLILFLLFAFAVGLGIKLVGTLLMGALTIIPASIAKIAARSMKQYLSLSAVLGGGISFLGVLISRFFGFLPGPTTILLGFGLFLLTLIFMKR